MSIVFNIFNKNWSIFLLIYYLTGFDFGNIIAIEVLYVKRTLKKRLDYYLSKKNKKSKTI